MSTDQVTWARASTPAGGVPLQPKITLVIRPAKTTAPG